MIPLVQVIGFGPAARGLPWPRTGRFPFVIDRKPPGRGFDRESGDDTADDEEGQQHGQSHR